MKREEIFVTLHGKTKSILQWCFEYGTSPSVAYERYEKGVRGKKLFLQNDSDRLSKSVVHHLWGGKWVKAPVRWNQKQKWVYVEG